jgi:hypothetical protein
LQSGIEGILVFLNAKKNIHVRHQKLYKSK